MSSLLKSKQPHEAPGFTFLKVNYLEESEDGKKSNSVDDCSCMWPRASSNCPKLATSKKFNGSFVNDVSAREPGSTGRFWSIANVTSRSLVEYLFGYSDED